MLQRILPLVAGINTALSSAHVNPKITIRNGNQICEQENIAVSSRKTSAHKAIQNFVQSPITIDQVPTIGLACSGGGSRAAIATLGVLRGLEKIGLLDGVNYAAGVSGSTWTLTSWMYHQQMNLDQLTTFLKEKLRHEFSFKNVDRYLVGQILATKRKNSRRISLNEIWGALLAQVFLGTPENSGQSACLGDLASQTLMGTYPVPLFTAVIGQTSPHYQWAEFSPFEIGSTYLNTWIHPSIFGKKFTGSSTTDIHPGESLGYLLGIFGSAYAASTGDAWERFRSIAKSQYNVTLPSPFSSDFFEKANFRISPPHVSNFARLHGPNQLKDKDYLSFIDAGVAFNLPFPPLLRRNVEVYIVCNASGTPGALESAQTYAQQNGLPFPSIDFKKVAKKTLSVCVDKNNPAAPIIIYIPNFQKFATTKFRYSNQQFDQVLNSMEQAVTENADLIKAAIKLAVAKKLRGL